MSLREEIEYIIDNLTDRDTIPYKEVTNEIIEIFEKRIDRIIEEELERMLIQGHTFYGEPTITEIPVDKVKEMLK